VIKTLSAQGTEFGVYLEVIHKFRFTSMNTIAYQAGQKLYFSSIKIKNVSRAQHMHISRLFRLWITLDAQLPSR